MSDLNKDKLFASYDLLSNLEDNDVFGSSIISSLQEYDINIEVDVISKFEGRPDLLVSDKNNYGYLLFANPKTKWSLGELYSYYPNNIIMYANINSAYL